MPGRPLSAAQLQHNRDIAKKGGQATAAKYGGYHFAHIARTARAHGTYVRPPIKAPFASLRAKQAAARLAKGKARTPRAPTLGRVLNLSIVKKTSSLTSQLGVGRSTGRSTLPRSTARRGATTRRRPAVR